LSEVSNSHLFVNSNHITMLFLQNKEVTIEN